MPTSSQIIRVFLSSPGDVAEERSLAVRVLEDLRYDPLLRDQVTIETVAWDIASGTPMLATMTPQEAINQGLPKPSDCDIVIVILWSRMGTPLPFPDYQKANGEHYLSGTEWEFLDAMERAKKAAKRGDKLVLPQIVVYRRTEQNPLYPDDVEFQQKYEQWRRVQNFFGGFVDVEGAIRQGYNSYATPSQFQTDLESHLKTLIKHILETPIARQTPISSETPHLWQGSPFPGLRAFTPSDEPIFFGRGVETDDLIDLLRNNHFVAIVGASGSGKSSLVGAGLLPSLKHNAIEGSKDWLLPDTEPEQRWIGLRFTPGEVGDNPFMALATRLVPLLKRTPRQIADDLAAHPETLPDLITPLFAGHETWMEAFFFIDQFEELFTLVHKGYQTAFIKMLSTISQSERLRAVVTLRADFYERCVEVKTLGSLFAVHLNLSAPDQAALYQMIARPADRAGLVFEDGLVERILADTGDDPGALALAAYALDELYRKGQGKGVLGFDAYRELEGVQGAIGKRAELTYQALDAAAKQTLPDVFRELVETNERGEPTRRRALLSMVAKSEPAQKLVDKFTEARLLTKSKGENDQPIVEVAHEALLRSWPTLREWITRETGALRLRHLLEQNVTEWERHRRETSFLLAGTRLEEAEKWRVHFPASEQIIKYIEASQRRRHNLNLRTAAASVVLVLAVIGIVLAGVSANDASNKSAIFESKAQEANTLAAQANLQSTQANAQLITATNAQGQAVFAANKANTEVGYANSILTPIPITLAAVAGKVNDAYGTLTHVAQQVSDSQKFSESLRLAALANQSSNGQAAVLLGIRALQLSDTYQADEALGTALNKPYEQWRKLVKEAGSRMAFSPNGKLLVTNGANSQGVIVWSFPSMIVVWRLVGHSGDVNDVAVSPNGQFIASASSDGTVRLWNLSTGQEVQRFTTPKSRIFAVAFSPDSSTVISGGDDNTVSVWDVIAGNRRRVMKGHTKPVKSVQVSPNGQYALSGSDDASVIVWDMSTGIGFKTLTGPTNGVVSVAFSPDQTLVAAGSTDHTVRVWHLASGMEIRKFTTNEYVTQIGYSPDGRYVASADVDFKVNLWEVGTGNVITYSQNTSNPVFGLVFTPDGHHVLSSNLDSYLRLWAVPDDVQPTDLALRQDYSHTEINSSNVAYAPNGRFIAVGKTDSIVLWNPVTGQELRQMVETNPVNVIAISPDNRIIAAGSGPIARIKGPQELSLWDADSGMQIRRWAAYNKDISSLTFTRDGRYLVSLGSDEGHDVRIWDAASGNEVRRFPIDIDYVSNVAVSPDSKLFAIGGYRSHPLDDSTYVWDIATGNLVHKLSGPIDGGMALDFSPDGNYLIAGGGNPYGAHDYDIRVWDMSTGNEVRRLVGHRGPITFARFSADSRYVVSTSYQDMRIWNVRTGQLVRMIVTHANSAVFSPDAVFIVTHDMNYGIKLFPVSRESLIAVACQRVMTDLTTDERRQYSLDDTPTCPAITNSPLTGPTWTEIPVTLIPTQTALAPLTLVPSPMPSPIANQTAQTNATPTTTLVPSTIVLTQSGTATPLPVWTMVYGPSLTPTP